MSINPDDDLRGSGVSATLTAGDAGATSVPLTLSVAGGTIISWDLQEQHSSDDGTTWSGWASVATGLTSATYTATGLSPAPMRYRFQPVNILAQAEPTGNVVSVATEALEFLPLIEDRTYIAPMGGTMGTKTIPGGESRLLKLHPVINQSFTHYEILLLNPFATTYDVKFCAVGNMAASEAQFDVLPSMPRTVPAGDGSFWQEDGADSLRPGVLSLGKRAITMDGGNGLQLAIELSAGAPAAYWGGNAMGFDNALTVIPRSLSTSFDLSGAQESWGIQPCIAVIFYGLETPAVTLPFLGDSWVWGYGYNNQPSPGALGIPYALARRWEAAGVKINPVNFGRVGATTSANAARMGWFAETFAPRCMAAQYYSINNDMRGEGNANVEANFVAGETALSPQPMLPLILAGNDAGNTGWWPPVKALEDACKASRPDTIDLSAPIVNSADGTILDGYDYLQAHPNDNAYALMESTAHAAIRAWCEAKAGQAL